MAIHVRGLHKSFEANHVLRGLDLDIETGDSVVILGGSGAGKSVFLRHLAGLHTADQGRVLVDDLDLARLSKREMYRYRRRIGMSFQEGALFDSLSALENVAFPIRRHERHLKEPEVRQRAQHCLEQVGMPGVADLMPSQLSGGMRRRVGFARAIALEPEILLFDEPTTGLDPILTSVLAELIVALREQLHTTTVTITHDIALAKKIANRVAMLFKGQLIHLEENPRFFESDNPVVRQFVEGRADGPATKELYK